MGKPLPGQLHEMAFNARYLACRTTVDDGGSEVLVNIDHVVSLHPLWNQGKFVDNVTHVNTINGAQMTLYVSGNVREVARRIGWAEIGSVKGEVYK